MSNLSASQRKIQALDNALVQCKAFLSICLEELGHPLTISDGRLANTKPIAMTLRHHDHSIVLSIKGGEDGKKKGKPKGKPKPY